jgi:photosystem II stability/assembly factor-like uncharacterized protein
LVSGRIDMLLKVSLTVLFLLAASFTFFRIMPKSSLPNKKVSGVVFLDENHGFVQLLTLSHPEAFETTDGGKTWKRVEQGVPGFRTGRSFATTLIGWSIDEKSEDGLEKEAYDTLYLTQDGGRTWTASLKTDRKGDFVFGGIQAMSEGEVWAVGISGTYHTLDGGKTWGKSGPSGTGLQFLDAHRGWIQDAKLWHTADAGRTWASVENGGKRCFGGLDFFFLDDLHGWSVSGESEGNIEGNAKTGHIVATSDGGRTCTEVANLPGHILGSVFFLNEREGWVGGVGAVLKTDDGGHTWSDTSKE